MALPVGSSVPHLSLKTLNAEGLADVALNQHIGDSPVLLLFFPAAFTGVCTQELCDASNGVHNLEGAVVYGISCDTPFAQSAWARQSGITVTLLSDYSRAAAEAFDVVLPDLAGLGPASKRAAFVIDKAGTIVYSEETPTPLDLPNFEAIKAAIVAAS